MSPVQRPHSLECYTIGHSHHSVEAFINILQRSDIDCIVDVRSVPYSQYAPQFDRSTLKTELIDHNIYYIYMGDKLGGRYEEDYLLFPDGTVNYSRVRQTRHFQKGIKRLVEGVRSGYRISLVCTEKNPLDCHRFVLISPELIRNGVSVYHILYDGEIVSNDKLEEMLLRTYNLQYADMCLFEPMKPREDILHEAYDRRNKDIGYNRKGKERFK